MSRLVVVTGAAGYIGSVLVRRLLAGGDRVLGIDRLLFGDHGVRELAGDGGFELLEADLRSAESYRHRLSEVDAIVHLAAIVGDPACAKEPELARETNLEATLRLFENAAAAGVGRFVFASTCSNYGR
ncbi:MAG: NAD-dependent epimerase/dehydratase family protein, partial [Acidobacteria bacterium]|nr:NAD-dependent epimerase/dehydratase family protein [Acidobacteriota bacterium]